MPQPLFFFMLSFFLQGEGYHQLCYLPLSYAVIAYMVEKYK